MIVIDGIWKRYPRKLLKFIRIRVVGRTLQGPPKRSPRGRFDVSGLRAYVRTRPGYPVRGSPFDFGRHYLSDVWHFDAYLSGKPWQFDGTSVVRFAEDGRVSSTSTRDVGRDFYERLPFIGQLLGVLRRLLRVA